MRTNLSAYGLKLLILITLVLMGGLAHAAIVRACAQDLAVLMRTAVLGLYMVAVGAVRRYAAWGCWGCWGSGGRRAAQPRPPPTPGASERSWDIRACAASYLVLEQTFALLHQFKRLAVLWGRRTELHDAFVSLAVALVCWRRHKKTRS
ncbi:hypothetical protein ACFQ7F_00555 [Streptomyces sp. NPDC056486]|uniref:hypothetical protein n=1 Tax=Streptomyces sp. NPDC056486 TaxID=3345835 RepID=UPI0036AA432A